MGNKIYILDNDQPTTCPKCGARTTFDEFTDKEGYKQRHTCLNPICACVFVGEFESEEERTTYL